MAALLGGCGDTAMNAPVSAWNLLLGQEGELAYDPEKVRGLPYATMEASIGTAASSLIVLGRANGNELHWIAADHTAVVTRYGRVVATAGLPENLTKTRFPQDDALRAERPDQGLRMIDISPQQAYNIPVYCQWHRAGKEKLSIIDRTIDTEIWREDCSAPKIDWSFSNLFWRDSARTVWQTKQYYHPDAPAIRTRLLTPFTG